MTHRTSAVLPLPIPRMVRPRQNWYEGAGKTDSRFLHKDERGSVIAVTNGSNAALLAINAYDDFGIPAAGNLGRFQYSEHRRCPGDSGRRAAQQYLPDLGLYHYKARVYSPTLGRFLQTDPIGYGDGLNLYAYVGNDPINSTDPSGLRRFSIGGRTCIEGIATSGETDENGNFIGQTFSTRTVECFQRELSQEDRIENFPFYQILNQFRDLRNNVQDAIASTQEHAARNQALAQRSGENSNSTRPAFCNSFLFQRGQAFSNAGTIISNTGLGIAILGAPIAGVGATPGLAIATLGAALSGIGALEQTIAGSTTAPVRVAIDAVGGRTFRAIANSPLGEGVMGGTATNILDQAIPNECR